ncbi:MAG: TetR/AcrR family transcriptional regulator [Fibromonadaceae bacterium]|jgi:AcrR family transcriptional regulator|nr:TetR/AcrR family transcriptional regulator [Fibromonadaceae bacterium]
MNKHRDKRALILDAMGKLIAEGRAADCSVSEIARTAGIGKGSVYYYYRSKREIEIDLYSKTYGGFVENCRKVLEFNANALEKLKTLFKTYYSQSLNLEFDEYLHLPQNAEMHQKVLASLVDAIGPILSKIIKQGVSEGVFDCEKADEFAEIYVCVFAFLFDVGIFRYTTEETLKRLTAFAELMERGLKAKPGILEFVCDKEFLFSLKTTVTPDFHLSNA